MPELALLTRLHSHAAARPDDIAYREASNDRTLTWRALADGVAGFANAVRSTISPASTVMLCAANQIEYPIAFLGILAAGCDVFPISADVAEVELLRAVAHARALAIVGHERALQIVGDRVKSWGIDSLNVGSALADRANDSVRQGGPYITPALLLQSSGTTGLPKIVRRSGLSLDVVSSQMAEAVGFTPDDHVLAAVPLTHSYGLEHGLLAPVWAGSTVHLCRGLDVPTMLCELAGNQITIFPAVPSMIEMLAGVSEAPAIKSLRTAYTAGAPLPASVVARFTDRFGVRLSQLYGATEIGSVTFNSPREEPFDSTSVGRAMRGVVLRIVHITDNTSLPAGEEGHLIVRADSMFEGYLHEKTELIEGYFPTGDLARLEYDGRLYITGRLKLLIDVGGMKVNPLEVEAVLCQHPDVAECVVVPIQQSETVNRLRAVVTPRDPAVPIAIESLRAFAKSHLNAYKVPRIFDIRQALPKSPTGKILRHTVETETSDPH